jgi:polysaccharide deacetylase family protein (PEP-CTERM system associated)
MSQTAMNVMSVDVEDWFSVENMRGIIPRQDWDRLESRVERNVGRLLDLFSTHRIEATFFVLGWIAERHPDMVGEIARRGHEVASHGYSHNMLTRMTPEEFDADLKQSLEMLARAGVSSVLGFRAPTFSVTRKTMWATDVLKSRGLAYDSSVFPIGFHPDYGIADAPLVPHQLPNGIWELPMSCAEVFGRRIPCSGGGYFRLFPYPVMRALMRRSNAQGRPVVFYLHPWEIDPDQPRIHAMPRIKRFRHYNNLERTYARLERLLGDFQFTSARRLLNLAPTA